MKEVIELARFTVKPEEEEQFLATRPAMVEAALRHLPGLRRLELVKLDNGEWVDIVVWSDRASADAAPAKAGERPEFAAWLSHVDADTGMDLGVIYDRAQADPVAAD